MTDPATDPAIEAGGHLAPADEPVTIEVAGSLPIAFADFGIQKPNSFAVLSIADQGTMEFQLFFARG